MRKKKNHSKIKHHHLFLIGLITGIGLHWLPISNELTRAQLSSAEWRQTDSSSESFPLPTVAPIIQRQDYSLAYDARHKNAHWVYTKLSKHAAKKQLKRKECDFHEDLLIPKHVRATNKDYKDSGFDRGHLYPAADASSQEAMQESFYLSNITPQNPQFNRGYWKKLENHLRELTEDYETLHVFIGPLYAMHLKQKGVQYIKYQVIGENQVAVPTHFFAVIFVEDMDKQLFSKSYVLPNRLIEPEIPLSQFLTNLETVEKMSGILFPFKS